MPDLVVLVPSRGRPAAATALAHAFHATSTADSILCFVVDRDDPTADQYESGGRVMVTHGDHANMGEALNRAAVFWTTVATPPFALAFMGDDHMPRTVGWDERYIAVLRELGAGLVFGNDLLKGRSLPTQVAMTSDIVRTLGFFSPPAQAHLYLDNFWLELGRQTAIRYLPDVIVEHRHPTAGKAAWDEGYKRVNAPEVYEHDRLAWESYLADGFADDVDKVRLLLPPQEWRLFEGDTPFVSTLDFHRDRDRAPHLEQPGHRPRLLAAAEAVAEVAALTEAPTVSDLGCGDGGLLSLLTVPAWGYDFAPSNVAGWGERGVTATALDVFGVDRNKVEFGTISVATEVLEHIADPHGTLRWIARNSRHLIASSPRFEHPGYHPEEHAWAWNEAGFRAMFEANGWRILAHRMVGASQLIVAESTL